MKTFFLKLGTPGRTERTTRNWILLTAAVGIFLGVIGISFLISATLPGYPPLVVQAYIVAGVVTLIALALNVVAFTTLSLAQRAFNAARGVWAFNGIQLNREAPYIASIQTRLLAAETNPDVAATSMAFGYPAEHPVGRERRVH